MERRIQRLPQAVANKIAAGEVVQSPFNVVKELVENAIDAAAQQILVRLREGGLQSIEVVDDGVGIAREDLPLAVERHATSKIVHDEDLQQLATMGFRGEALPAIAAVARLSLTSCRRDATVGGTLKIEGGVLQDHHDVGTAPGTTVLVEDLFFNLPARRKFMRSPAYEYGKIHHLVRRFALAYPQITFALFHNGKRQEYYPACRSAESGALERVNQVLQGDRGQGWPERLGFLASECPEMPGARLQIFHAGAGVGFGNNKQHYFFVNRRMISDRNLLYAVSEGFRSFIMEGQYPGVVLFLEMDPTYFDVNVHPSKEEVRFHQTAVIVQWVRRSLQNELAQTKVEAPQAYRLPNNSWQFLRETPTASYRQLSAQQSGGTQIAAPAAMADQLTILRSTPFASLRLIGQLRASYLVCESGDYEELVLIDQHAAHERILFDRFYGRFNGPQGTAPVIETQPLLEPLLLPASVEHVAWVQETGEALLRGLGFEVEVFGERELLLRTLPTFHRGSGQRFVQEVIDEMMEMGAPGQLQANRHRLLATLACHSAIRFNQRLTEAEMLLLLRQLDETSGASNCPHGRPVMLRLPIDQLARQFGR